MKKNTLRIAGASGAVAALALTGCAAGSDGGDAGSDPIQVAVVSGWAEGEVVTEMWTQILEDKGYDVEVTAADIAAVYTGLANGDYDVYLDSWLPVTHAQYMERFGDDIVDLGAWNVEGVNAIAVNEDAPIDSLSELADNADLFGNRIVGIEPGSGLMTMTQETVIPGYGLEGMELVSSSSPAMLAELKSATDAGQNIAVTLWQPHWAFDAFPVKMLEDPDGLFGDPEEMHTVAATSFEQDYPEVFQWLTDFEMDNTVLGPLQRTAFYDRADDELSTVIADWIAENQEWVDSLTS
jgi:glycine betaine/proline transport system substrate-binding protein